MPSNISFYDPLYDDIAFQRRFWEKVDPVTDKFYEIIGTYEVTRLHFLRREGISWLAFPSASYTRFLSVLGCWFLADVALENVRVHPRSRSESPWLTTVLEEVGLLEEFRLAVLLRDIGAFPFSNTIKNNDVLKARYIEKEGIHLRPESFTKSLINGDPNEFIFRRYLEYLEQKTGGVENERLISSLLQDDALHRVKRDWVVYLISPDQEIPDKNQDVDFKKILRLGKLLRHFVRGMIDVGTMDRTSRASYVISGQRGLLNSQRILKSVLLDLNLDKKDDGCIVLFDNGPRDVIDALYNVQNVFTRHMLQNPTRMAYEVMLNRAINIAWNSSAGYHSENMKFFKTYFPFMDDEEFLRILSDWNNEDVRELIRRVRYGEPYHCIGRFKVASFMHEPKGFISPDIIDRIQQERRNNLILNVEESYPQEQYLLRLSLNFGKPKIPNLIKRTSINKGAESILKAWLNPYKLQATTRPIDNLQYHEQREKKWKKLHEIVPENLGKSIVEHEDLERRTFWLFSKKKIEDKDKSEVIKTVDRSLDAKYIGDN